MRSTQPCEPRTSLSRKVQQMAHVLASGGGKALINVDDTALLLLDHRTASF